MWFGWFVKPDDKLWVQKRKQILTCGGTFLTGAAMQGFFEELTTSDGTPLSYFYLFFTAVLFLLGVIPLVYMKIRGSAPDLLIELFLLVAMLCILMADTYWRLRSSVRQHGWCVIVLDVALLCQLKRPIITYISLTLITLYALMWAAEDATRFGLFDIGGADAFTQLCGCSKPPCKAPIDVSIANTLVIAVYFLDYYFTRGFADRAISENRRLQEALHLAGDVVACLVDFDLKQAELLLMSDDKNQLHDVLEQMIVNLGVYRPYLPDSLFARMSQAESLSQNLPRIECWGVGRVDPPLGSRAAIVFTDIQSSTSLWEQFPLEMQQGLKLHNFTIREVMNTFGGYEVKTIGDAFMVAFGEFRKAAEFGLAVQVALSTQDWPTALKPGLGVRIAAHYGDVSVEKNELTSRFDYFGPTVNKASRMEGVGVKGTVTVVDELRVAESQFCESLTLGTFQLRGFRDKVTLSSLVHSSHSNRLSEIQRDIENKREPQSALEYDSHSSVSTASSTHAVVPRIKLLFRKCVTVAKVSLETEDTSYTFTCFQMAFIALMSNLERTGGAVVTVFSTVALLSWNAARECTAHVESAFRFSKLLDGRKIEYNMGVATGSVSMGEVGSVNQKFIAVIGPCVRLSELLLESALEINAVILHASAEPEGYSAIAIPGLRTRVRPIDRWVLNNGPASLLILECRAQHRKCTWEWTPAYKEAFHNKEVDEIIRESPDEDPITNKVVHLINTSTSLRESVQLKVCVHHRASFVSHRPSFMRMSFDNELSTCSLPMSTNSGSS